jgi:hypothetical protein
MVWRSLAWAARTLASARRWRERLASGLALQGDLAVKAVHGYGRHHEEPDCGCDRHRVAGTIRQLRAALPEADDLLAGLLGVAEATRTVLEVDGAGLTLVHEHDPGVLSPAPSPLRPHASSSLLPELIPSRGSPTTARGTPSERQSRRVDGSRARADGPAGAHAAVLQASQGLAP